MIIKKTARFITLSALYLIPFFALIVANNLFFPFITGKAFFFRILIEVAFAGWAVLACIDPKYRPKASPLAIGVTAFMLIALVADLLGVLPIRSLWSNYERMEGWVTIVHLWGLFMVMTNFFGADDNGESLWRRWLNTELFVGALVGLYGVGQLFGWLQIHQGSTRIDATIGNAAYMAVYMLWNAGIALYMYVDARARKAASSFSLWLYPILAVFFSFLLFETATRGTILGWVGGIALGLFVYAVWGKGEPKKLRYAAGGAIVAMVVVGGAFWALRSQPAIKGNDVLGRLASISLTNSETTARLYIWQMAIQGGLERPVLGWGQENFNYIFNAHYNPKLWGQEQWFDRAHDVYLDWFVDAGFLGLLSYLSLYALFIYAVWKSPLSVKAKSVLLGLLAGYAVHNVFVFDNLASYIPFFAFLAFADNLRPRREAKVLGTKPVSADAVEYVIAPLMAVALILVLYFVNVRPIQANTALIAALESCGTSPELFQNVFDMNVYISLQETREQLLSCAADAIQNQSVPTSVKNQYYALADTGIKDQIAATKGMDARIYALGGSFMGSVGNEQLAEQYLAKAHELSPAKQSITLQLAVTYINSGQAAKAVPMLKAAYESAPDDQQSRLTYAIALIVTGNEAEAHRLFGNDPAIFDSLQTAEAFMFVKQYDRAIAILKQLDAANPTDMNLVMQYVQALYAAGRKADVVSVLRSTEKLVEKDHPEYVNGIETLIKQVLSGQ